MTWASNFAQGTEVLLNQDNGLIIKHLTSMVRLMRAQLLPNSDFSHASVLRGTYGIRLPMVYADPQAVCIMWKRREKQVYLGSVVNIRPEFDPMDFVMVLLWN